MTAQAADCTKRMRDLSPYDAVQCFFEADAWHKIGQNLRSMWTNLLSRTIGEWLADIFSLAVSFAVAAAFLALFASFILPPIFLYLLIKRYALKTPPIFDGNEHKPKNFCGGYLLLSGIILVMVYPHEWWFGGWVAICGIAIFLLGSSWWALKQGARAGLSGLALARL